MLLSGSTSDLPKEPTPLSEPILRESDVSPTKHIEELGSGEHTVGERPAFPKTFSKSTPSYRILHHTLIKHREMITSIL
jgi:hypothetical protein